MTLQLRVTLNAGAPQTGGVVAAYSDVVHLDAANYVGWSGTATWTIYAYPDGFTVPAGWTSATVEQASGLFATVYQYQGTTPPSFTLPAATYWGKWLLSLSVTIGGETATDEATGVEIVSPGGLHDTAWREGVQFGDWQKWVADVAANWRILEAAIASFASDATVTATANKIVRRGSSAEAKAAWLESGTGTPATTGLVRSANNTAIIGSYGGGAYNVPVLTVNASDVHVHGDDARTGGYESRAKTGGLWKWIVNGAEILRASATQLLFAHDVSAPALKQAQRADNAACADLTIEAQTPFAAATLTNRDAPDVVLVVPSPAAGGATGAVRATVSGSDVLTVGAGYVAINGSGAATGAIRLANNAGIVAKSFAASDVPLILADAADRVVIGDSALATGMDLLVATGGGVDVSVNGTKVVGLAATGVATDAVIEKTAAAGVTVDGLLIKDSHLPAKYRWREEKWQKEDDALAATATTSRPFATLKYACTVTDVNYRAHDALTADNTDNVTITVYAYTAAGALVGKVAEYISNVATGGLASEVPKDFGSITNASCGADYGLVVAITKSGSGKIVPAGVLTVNTTLD